MASEDHFTFARRDVPDTSLEPPSDTFQVASRSSIIDITTRSLPPNPLQSKGLKAKAFKELRPGGRGILARRQQLRAVLREGHGVHERVVASGAPRPLGPRPGRR